MTTTQNDLAAFQLLPTLTTVGDLLDLLNDNLNSQSKELRAHAATLQGPRKRGSTTVRGLDVLPRDRELVPAPDEWDDVISEGCAAYCFDAPELEGRLGAISLGDALAEHIPVSVRIGSHGVELFIDQPADTMPRCSHVTVIIGQFKGEAAVFTWHPGRPRQPAKLTYDTAVKTHNGN